MVGGDFRTLFNTNASKNSEITVETSRAINSEISSQMSRKLEELKADLNSHIVDVINSALEEKVIPGIKNAIECQNSDKTTNLDLRSNGPHPSNFGQVRTQRDLRSNGLHPEKIIQVAQDAQKDFPRLVAMSSNRIHRCRENSTDSNQNDENDGSTHSAKNTGIHMFHQSHGIKRITEDVTLKACRKYFLDRKPQKPNIQ